MDSTSIAGEIQVTQEVVDSLQGSYFEFRCRGQIKVKGKGDMITYFLNEHNGQRGDNRSMSHEFMSMIYNNLENFSISFSYLDSAHFNYQPSMSEAEAVIVPRRNQSIHSHPCSSQMYNPNYMPNVVNSDSNYSKKSYNYMASPNYLQYENTYQKYKNHMKNVIPSEMNVIPNGRNNVDYMNGSNENISNGVDQQQSSDDEGGFQSNGSQLKTQFNYTLNNHSHQHGNDVALNNNYGIREVEPLLIQQKGHKYEPPHYNCTGPMIQMQNLQNAYNPYPNHLQQINYQVSASHNNKPHYRNISPQIPSSVHPYAKPLPKIPSHIGKVFMFIINKPCFLIPIIIFFFYFVR